MGDYDEPGSPGRALQRLAHGAETIPCEPNSNGEWVPRQESALRQLVSELANGYKWNWCHAISQRDAADAVLKRMVELGLIEGRQHPHSSATYSVYRVDGELFGRLDGVDEKLFG